MVEISKKMSELLENEEFSAKLMKCNGEDEAKKLWADYGVDLEAELKSVEADDNGELNEEALGNVVGGMSHAQAWNICLSAYSYIIRGKAAQFPYSSSQIKEAQRVCQKDCIGVIKWGVTKIISLL